MNVYQRQSDSVKIPTELDWAWTAGFLEGEGSFCPMSGSDKRARVQANQNEREPLERLLQLFGGRIYKLRKRDHYVWMLRGVRAEVFLKQLLPMMCRRRQGQIQRTLQSAFSVEHGSTERYAQHSHLRKGRKMSSEVRAKIGIAVREHFVNAS